MASPPGNDRSDDGHGSSSSRVSYPAPAQGTSPQTEGAHSGLPPFGVLGAAQFLTRLPIRLRAAPHQPSVVAWFPVVGAVIGAAVGGVAVGLGELVPTQVAAVVAIVFGLALTGAFHEDGLADSADALGGWSPEQRRDILKDSRHGSYGVAAMTSSIVLRIACVASLGPAAAFGGLVAAHTLGRAAAVGVMATTAPSSVDGLAARAGVIDRRRAALSISSGAAIAALAVGWWVLPLVVAVTVGALVVRHIAVVAFEGVSGDLLGAAEQIGECLVLIVVSGLAMRHGLWWA